MKSKGVTTQMKALDEYFLMVVLMLLLNRVHVFANFMFHLNRETWQWKKLTKLVFLLQISSRTLLIHSVNCYLMYFQTNWKKQTNKNKTETLFLLKVDGLIPWMHWQYQTPCSQMPWLYIWSVVVGFQLRHSGQTSPRLWVWEGSGEKVIEAMTCVFETYAILCDYSTLQNHR